MESTLGFAYASFYTNENGCNRIQGVRGRKSTISQLPPSGLGVVVKAALSKTSLRIPDIRREPAYVDFYANSGKDPTMISELAVPAIVNDKAVAILNVESVRINAFSSEDQMLVEILANHVAAALNRIRQEGELRQHYEHLQDLVKERTRQLSESEARFRELADLLPQIVFEIQEDGKIQFLNRLGLRSLGYSEEELQSLNAFQVFSPEEVDRARESANRVMRGETPEDLKESMEKKRRAMMSESPESFKTAMERAGREFILMRKDRSTFPAIIHSTPIIRNGNPAGLRGIAVDITERKQIEEYFLRAKHLAAIGETTAMIGHDLRNPLQGATCAVYLARELLKSWKTEEKEKALELLGVLEDSICYMDKIVSDLQSYAAPVRADPVETNLPELITETLSTIRIPKNVETRLVSHENISRVSIDPVLVKRVLTNLTTNAIQAMPKGGKLTVQCSREGE